MIFEIIVWIEERTGLQKPADQSFSLWSKTLKFDYLLEMPFQTGLFRKLHRPVWNSALPWNKIKFYVYFGLKSGLDCKNPQTSPFPSEAKHWNLIIYLRCLRCKVFLKLNFCLRNTVFNKIGDYEARKYSLKTDKKYCRCFESLKNKSLAFEIRFLTNLTTIQRENISSHLETDKKTLKLFEFLENRCFTFEARFSTKLVLIQLENIPLNLKTDKIIDNCTNS
jgi:hypothetical protein